MIPNTDLALRNLAQHLLVSILPDLSTEYAMSDAALTGVLMNAIADEIAEGINRRLIDIEEMQVLLATCELGAVERSVLSGSLPNYTLKEVNARHDALTSMLIVWHEKSEQEESLTDLNLEIWRYLQRHSQRHTINAEL